MNPRYSMRSFASYLGLSPSKLSEILNGKKGLSASKAQAICQRLHLGDSERQLFLLSVEAQHARSPRQKREAKSKLNELVELLGIDNIKSLSKATAQRNAWYFGAVEALLREGISEISEIKGRLGITALQVENSMRLIRRLKRLYPETERLTIEPMSAFKKVEDTYAIDPTRLECEANFLFLSREERAELDVKIFNLIKRYKSPIRTPRASESKRTLYMINQFAVKLTND